MSSPTPVVYVFHGQDEPGLKDRLADFCSDVTDPPTAELNTTRLEGKTVRLGEIESAVGTFPFLADSRLVLVDNLTESGNHKDLIDKLADVIAAMPDWSRLVFVEVGSQERSQDSPGEQKRKAARRRALKKLITVVENDPRGKVVRCEPPRDLNRWVQQRAAGYQATIEPSAARLLIDRTNADLTLTDTELAKLATYTNGKRPITAEDVTLLTPYTAEANIFHMVDALGQRNGKRALQLLHRLLDDGDEPLRIFGMIVRQYRLLIQMREQLDGRKTVGSAAEAMSVSEFVARKVAGQARMYRLEQLERIYHHLLKVDLEIKTGEVEPALALDVLVTQLAGRG